MQLLAKSAICPGIITVIWSLITSNTTGVDGDEDPDDEVLDYINRPKHKIAASLKKEEEEDIEN